MSTPSPQMHVLAGLDGRPAGWAALRQAADLAAKLRASLDVVHAVGIEDLGYLPPAGLGGLPVPLDSPEMRAAIEETTAGLRSAVGGLLRDYDVKWAFHTREGDPGSVLAELAEDTDAYCIVVGTRGEGVAATLNRLIRPSVSHALIQHCPRPVLVVSVNNAPADDV